MADLPPARFRAHHVKRHSIFSANRDDLLTRLAPATAVEALAAPAGALSACMDNSPSPDRDLAIRAALFSRRVWEWLVELEGWTWPASFDHAFLTVALSASESARYANRVDQIGHDLDRLDVEEIKKHVLANHVLPLSRPTTPATDSDLSSLSSSASSFIKMDDLTAVVTTIVMQALPNLARLSALLRLWTIRLRVLREVSPFLFALEDAEARLASALANYTELKDPETTLAATVAEAARILDHMLDCLEGMPDTLPDAWIDRVEALERGYAEWAAVRERNLMSAAETKHLLLDGAAADDDSAIASPGPGEPMPTSWPADGLNDDLETGRGLLTNSSHQTVDESLASTPESLSRVDKCHGHHHVSLPHPQCRLPMATVQVDALSAEDNSPLSSRAIEEDDDGLGLPPLRMSASRQSLNSQASTLIFSGFGALSSSPPDMSTSPAARLQDADDSPLHRRGKPDSDDFLFLKSPADASFADDFDDTMSMVDGTSYTLTSESGGAGGGDDQQLQQQISDIIDSIPAKIKLASEPVILNPPDLQLPRLRTAVSRDVGLRRSVSNLSTVSSSSRAATPSFTLSPAKHCRPRHRRAHQEIKVYHLSRSTGEPPIKLFIRCVGEHGERVMVRVGGGWADLSEYLKAYASHHGRRSNNHARVEICREVVSASTPTSHQSFFTSSPTRPGSAAAAMMTTTTTADDAVSPATPLQVRKMRALEAAYPTGNRRRPWTPSSGAAAAAAAAPTTRKEPSSSDSIRSRSSWFEDEDGSSFLGLAGPSGRKVEMTDENRAWVESVKEKVRIASGSASLLPAVQTGRFGDLGSVGSTRRLFPGGSTARRR